MRSSPTSSEVSLAAWPCGVHVWCQPLLVLASVVHHRSLWMRYVSSATDPVVRISSHTTSMWYQLPSSWARVHICLAVPSALSWLTTTESMP